VKLSTYVIGVPAVVLAAVVAVANRQTVQLSLDPFSQTSPALAFHLPLFAALFAALLAGVLLGGFASTLSRMKRRRPPKVPPAEKPKTLPALSSAAKLLPWNRAKPKSRPK
jgi:uncharacterized integral membrane protein